jgi:hypothetical protein
MHGHRCVSVMSADHKYERCFILEADYLFTYILLQQPLSSSKTHGCRQGVSISCQSIYLIDYIVLISKQLVTIFMQTIKRRRSEYRWLSLYALSRSAFSHIQVFISVLWGASISYPRPNFKAYFLRRTFSRLIRECDADDKLSIKEFWRQFNIKMATVMRFLFYAFSLYAAIDRNAPPVYNERHLYLIKNMIKNKKLYIYENVIIPQFATCRPKPALRRADHSYHMSK